MKKNMKKLMAYLLCAVMVFTCVFMVDAPKVKANAGDITFTISCANGSSGTVEYSLDNSTWKKVENDTTISASTIGSVTTVFIKANPGEGSQLDSSDGMQAVSYGGTQVDIYNDLQEDFVYKLVEYDSSKQYNVRISFDRAGSAPSPVSSTVCFEIGGNGTVSYSISNKATWTPVSHGTILTTSELTNGDKVYVKAEAADGSQVEQGEGRQLIMYDGNDYPISVTDLENGDFSFTYDSSKNYCIRINFVTNNGGGGGSSQITTGKYKVTMQVDSELTSFTPSVEITFLDSSGNIISKPETLSGDKEETDIPAGATQIKVATSREKLANARLRSSDSEEDLIDDIRNTEAGGFALRPIDTSKGYEVYFEFSNKMNVSWSYSSDTAAPDQLVTNATIELLKSDTAGDYWEKGRTDFNLTIGETYYFELAPDYGYQIKGLNINGYTVEPQDSTGVFQFVMKDSNFHIQSVVGPADDKVDNTSTIIKDVAINNNADRNIKGNLKLSAANAADDTNALSVVDGEMYGTVDLGLEQIISKGNGSYWESGLSELSGNVELSLDVPANQLASGQTYSIVREHNGTYEELDATYDATSGKLTFATDKFSKYTIVKVADPTNDVPENSQKTEDNTKSEEVEEQPEEPIVIPQPIGDVVGGTAVTSWSDLDRVLDAKKVLTSTNPTAGITTTTNSPKTELVQLKLRNNNTTVPASTFANLSNTNYSGLHLFTGNGTAVTFVNDAKLAGQKAINVGCSTVSLNGRKIMTFKSTNKLSSTVVLHATVPAGTKTVSVYFTGADNKRALLTTVAPTAAGRLCFAINQLGKYELVYN